MVISSCPRPERAPTTDLRLSRFPLMAGNADFVKEAMELLNDSRHLGRKVTCVHGWLASRLRASGCEADCVNLEEDQNREF